MQLYVYSRCMAEGGDVTFPSCKQAEAVSLAQLRTLLAGAYERHASRCASRPVFELQSRFGVSSLYLTCSSCSTPELVI